MNFKQALIIAAVPSLISLTAAYYSQQVDLRQSVIQARMAERQWIQQEALDISKSTGIITYAYLIPSSDNRAWGNYYDCRQNNKSRFGCAKEQKAILPKLTPPIIKTAVDFGYSS